MSERKMFHNPSVAHINRGGTLLHREDERVSSGARSSRLNQNLVLSNRSHHKVMVNNSFEASNNYEKDVIAKSNDSGNYLNIVRS